MSHNILLDDDDAGVGYNDDDLLNQIEEALRGEDADAVVDVNENEVSERSGKKKTSSIASRWHTQLESDHHNAGRDLTEREQGQGHRGGGRYDVEDGDVDEYLSDRQLSDAADRKEVPGVGDDGKKNGTATSSGAGGVIRKRGAAHLLRHQSNKRKYMELREELRKEEERRNVLLLSALPKDTAKRYKIHLNTSFHNSTVKKLLSYYYASASGGGGGAGTGHTKQHTYITSLMSNIMKTLVMYIVEYARELQVMDVQMSKRSRLTGIAEEVRNSVKDGNHLISKKRSQNDHEKQADSNDAAESALPAGSGSGSGLNEVYDIDSIENELQRINELQGEYAIAGKQSETSANRTTTGHDRSDTMKMEHKDIVSAESTSTSASGNANGNDTESVEEVKMNANDNDNPNGSESQSAKVDHNSNEREKIVGDESSHRGSASVDTSTGSENMALDREEMELGAIPPYYIRLAYLRLQQQGIVPSKRKFNYT